MSQIGYPAKLVCQMVNVTYRQLDYWDRVNLLKPSLSSAHGSGSRRLYSEHDLTVLRFMRAALDSGLRFDLLRPAVEEIQETDLGRDAYVMACGQQFVVFQNAEDLIAHIKTLASPCWVFPLRPEGTCGYCQHPLHDVAECSILLFPEHAGNPHARCLCVADQGHVPPGGREVTPEIREKLGI